MKTLPGSSLLVLVCLLALSACAASEGRDQVAAPGIRVGALFRQYRLEGRDWSSPGNDDLWRVEEVSGTYALLTPGAALEGHPVHRWVNFARVSEWQW